VTVAMQESSLLNWTNDLAESCCDRTIARASPAAAFDTTRLGQQGTLSSSEIVGLIAQSHRLHKEVKQALAEGKRQSVNCIGMRFPGQWLHLGGGRVAPYACDFGTKWLKIRARVRLSDRRGRAFEKITPSAMRYATRVRKAKPRWKWTAEYPFKD
jgi:hypothetical protein